MGSLHLRALHWSDDGELVAADRLILLNSLLPQSLPDVQLELIHTIECLAIHQLEGTPQVSES